MAYCRFNAIYRVPDCVQSISLCSPAVIPSIEMAAAGLDSIGAIVGYAVCSGISITSGSLVYSILSGPLQVGPSTAATWRAFINLPAVCTLLQVCMQVHWLNSMIDFAKMGGNHRKHHVLTCPALH